MMGKRGMADVTPGTDGVFLGCTKGTSSTPGNMAWSSIPVNPNLRPHSDDPQVRLGLVVRSGPVRLDQVIGNSRQVFLLPHHLIPGFYSFKSSNRHCCLCFPTVSSAWGRLCNSWRLSSFPLHVLTGNISAIAHYVLKITRIQQLLLRHLKFSTHDIWKLARLPYYYQTFLAMGKHFARKLKYLQLGGLVDHTNI